MTHGEKLLLVLFIITVTSEPPTGDVQYVIWRIVTVVLGVAFVNLHSRKPLPAAGTGRVSE